MAWLKVCDTAHSHPTVVDLAVGGKIPLLNEALGWLTRCASYSADHELDGWIPETQARVYATPDRYPILLKTARAVGILERSLIRGGPRNARGLALDMTSEDRVFHIRTREDIEVDRARRGGTRRQDETLAVRLRDGDQCRYCEVPVDFSQRKTARGGTYDHPDPLDRDTFVVACRACNQTKSDRTVAQWVAAGGLTLKDPPARPHYKPKTAEWLTSAGLLTMRPDTSQVPDPAQRAPQGAAPARTHTLQVREDAATPEQPSITEASAVQIRSRSDLDPSRDGLPRQAPPGRVGTGSGSGQARVGSGAQPDHPRTRDGPLSRRGTRGRRGRGPQPT